jgi:hypothetical protein
VHQNRPSDLQFEDSVVELRELLVMCQERREVDRRRVEANLLEPRFASSNRHRIEIQPRPDRSVWYRARVTPGTRARLPAWIWCSEGRHRRRRRFASD